MDWASESNDLATYLSSTDTGTSADSLVQVLQQRSTIGRQFTWVGGDTLLALGLSSPTVSPSLVEAYSQPQDRSSTELESHLPPHLLQLATSAFSQMLLQRQDQTLLVM